ncbi:DUF1842 domain-containing protein [Tenacibaculum agarivorans]|uniref:DUF1842 domain-containing protein n=1 Tax=Tenacibaculum agarivorans TaxID=1908389 RepID=UPI00094B9796|nr:DUF1842 domain-containing protein [Tenacibaculum agarivorans]
MTVLRKKKMNVENRNFIKGFIGNTNDFSTPISYFSLLISQEENIVSGIVEIKHLVEKSSLKFNVAGTINYPDFDKAYKNIHLKGECNRMVLPNYPSFGNYIEKFNAQLYIHENWTGNGSFSFGFQKATDAKVIFID